MQEVSIEVSGQILTAKYEVFDDTLVVYLPDGSKRETVLRGLKVESALRCHISAFILSKTRGNAEG